MCVGGVIPRLFRREPGRNFPGIFLALFVFLKGVSLLPGVGCTGWVQLRRAH